MKSTQSLLLAVLMTMPLGAAAQFDYTYLEGGYERVELDGIDESADGIGVRGSLAVAENIHLLGGVHSVEFERVDSDSLDVGIGYNAPVGPNVDFVGSVSYVSTDVEFEGAPFGGFDAEDDGYRADVGLRGAIAPAFELDGGIRYTDVGLGEDTSVYGRGLFGSGAVRLLTEIEANDDGETYLIGGRIDF